MKTTLFTLFALASSATATFDWLDAGKFSSPDNCDNKCVGKQQTGFKWEGLNLGKFTKYENFDFQGFTCGDDGKSKRDLLTGRTLQSKHIRGVATEDRSQASCFGSSQDKFSVKDFTVSTDYDTDLEFEYDMPDGSVCKQKQSCKKSGSVVKNTQCGGATKVKVCLPHKPTTPKQPCGFKFHDITFDCTPPKTTPKPPTTPSIPSIPVVVIPTPTPTPSPSEIETIPVTQPGQSTTSDASPVGTTSLPESEIETIPVTQPAGSTTTESLPITSDSPPFPANGTTFTQPGTEPSPETTPAPGTTIHTTNVVTEIRTNTITSCGPEVISCPADSTVISTETFVTSSVGAITTTQPAAPGTTEIIVDLTTVVVDVSTTICPVTATRVESGTTVVETGFSTSFETVTKTSTICTKCTAVASSTDVTPPIATETPSAPAETESQSPVTTTSTSSAPPAPTADCPAVLPKCINTWVEVSKCKSNADSDCFCKSNDLVEKIYQCLSAYGASDEEVDKAQNFFQGVCAPYVPQNPAIITDATTLIITATPAAPTAPVTTVKLVTTVVVPCTETAGPSQGSIIPGSSTTTVISTAVTVPQVVFETITGASSHVVSLVQGTPTAPANNVPVATTTPFIGAPTTLASIGLPPKGTGAITATPPQFTGAASRSSMNIVGVMGAGLIAALML